MCGVCAGNPAEMALGDVIVAEIVYTYDEGKQKRNSFEGDHRQSQISDTWLRAAQDLTPTGLPSFGEPSEGEARTWLLQRLYAGDDPRHHPARQRYFPSSTWEKRTRDLQDSGLVLRDGPRLSLTDRGRSVVEENLFYDVDGPTRLPFEIRVGPIASGNVVVKDGLTWEKLKKWGVRSVLGLEMEASAMGSIAHRLAVPKWIVAKGVMDHADPRKDDRYKPFAARASAEVLFKFLLKQFIAVDYSTVDDKPVTSQVKPGAVTASSKPTPVSHPRFRMSSLLHTSFLARGAQCAQSVVRVTAQFEDGSWLGTGFFVAPGRVLTSHHVLFNEDGRPAPRVEIAIGYELDGNGQDHPPTIIEAIPSTIVGDGADDWAVIDIPEHPAGVLPLELTGSIPSVKQGDQLQIISHPYGGRKMCSLTRNVVAFVDDQVVQYRTEDESSSGAPVFDKRWQVIAVHNRWTFLEDEAPVMRKQGIRIERIALGLRNRGLLP